MEHNKNNSICVNPANNLNGRFPSLGSFFTRSLPRKHLEGSSIFGGKFEITTTPPHTRTSPSSPRTSESIPLDTFVTSDFRFKDRPEIPGYENLTTTTRSSQQYNQCETPFRNDSSENHGNSNQEQTQDPHGNEEAKRWKTWWKAVFSLLTIVPIFFFFFFCIRSSQRYNQCETLFRNDSSENHGNSNQEQTQDPHGNEEAKRWKIWSKTWWKTWWKAMCSLLNIVPIFFFFCMTFGLVISSYKVNKKKGGAFYVLNIINITASAILMGFMVWRFLDSGFRIPLSVGENNDEESSMITIPRSIIVGSNKEDRNNEVAQPKPPQWKIDFMNAATCCSFVYALVCLGVSIWGITKSEDDFDLCVNIVNLILALLYVISVPCKIAYICSTRSGIPIRRQLI